MSSRFCRNDKIVESESRYGPQEYVFTIDAYKLVHFATRTPVPALQLVKVFGATPLSTGDQKHLRSCRTFTADVLSFSGT
jgi:hypothetical protein